MGKCRIPFIAGGGGSIEITNGQIVKKYAATTDVEPGTLVALSSFQTYTFPGKADGNYVQHISGNKYLHVYADGGSSSNYTWRARVLTLNSPGNWTAGTAVTLGSWYYRGTISIIKMTDSTFAVVVCHTYPSQYRFVSVYGLKISGTTVTSSLLELWSEDDDHQIAASVVKLSDTKLLVSYGGYYKSIYSQKYENYVYADIVQINSSGAVSKIVGQTVYSASNSGYGAPYIQFKALLKLSATSFVACYESASSGTDTTTWTLYQLPITLNSGHTTVSGGTPVSGGTGSHLQNAINAYARWFPANNSVMLIASSTAYRFTAASGGILNTSGTTISHGLANPRCYQAGSNEIYLFNNQYTDAATNVYKLSSSMALTLLGSVSPLPYDSYPLYQEPFTTNSGQVIMADSSKYALDTPERMTKGLASAATSTINGVTATKCTATTPGDVWVLNA